MTSVTKERTKAKRRNSCKSEHPSFKCLDCGKCTMHLPQGMEYYMVLDKIWTAVGLGFDSVRRYDGMLCISDLENRLGRELNRKDFTDCPLNQSVKEGGWNATPQLVERINRNTKRVPTI